MNINKQDSALYFGEDSSLCFFVDIACTDKDRKNVIEVHNSNHHSNKSRASVYFGW